MILLTAFLLLMIWGVNPCRWMLCSTAGSCPMEYHFSLITCHYRMGNKSPCHSFLTPAFSTNLNRWSVTLPFYVAWLQNRIQASESGKDCCSWATVDKRDRSCKMFSSVCLKMHTLQIKVPVFPCFHRKTFVASAKTFFVWAIKLCYHIRHRSYGMESLFLPDGHEKENNE